jgi:hypothetical protein
MGDGQTTIAVYSLALVDEIRVFRDARIFMLPLRESIRE